MRDNFGIKSKRSLYVFHTFRYVLRHIGYAMTQIKKITGILTIIEDAKNRGDMWADCALGEISTLTDIQYLFHHNHLANKFEITEGKK